MSYQGIAAAIFWAILKINLWTWAASIVAGIAYEVLQGLEELRHWMLEQEQVKAWQRRVDEWMAGAPMVRPQTTQEYYRNRMI